MTISTVFINNGSLPRIVYKPITHPENGAPQGIWGQQTARGA